jgi:GntR family carbon starvation induced transcriptional regulator
MIDKSVTGRAYDLLRARIIRCELAPGSRLNISALQGQWELSQAAIREALSRLTAEGLVEVERNRGYWVAPISTGGFRELTEALITIELPCIRSALACGDKAWERSLSAAFHRAAHALTQVAAGDVEIEAYSNEREGFYRVLLGACENRWLLWSWELLFAQTTRYRHLYSAFVRYDLDHLPSHRAILHALLSRNAKEAEALVLANYEAIMTYIEAEMVSRLANTA